MTAKLLAALGYLFAIVGANVLTTRYGMVPVGFGLLATAGTYLAGAAFVLRDAVQDTAGRAWSIGLIVIGSGISALLADGRIAAASACAFLLSELVDLAIYTPLRKKGYIRAAAASNLAGSVVDTVVFLSIAGFPLWASLPGQLVGKAWLTVAVVVAVGGARAVLRQPQYAEGA